jgi:filamentous hemagglutinin family protein
MRLAFSLAALSLMSSVGPISAQVVPDKKTTTAVAKDPTGRVTIGIAGANASGISHNTYSEFSAPKAGIALNNRGIDATTIVNEVTSTKRSFINGPIEVLGSRAHVVLANPNGITVDGGLFINTGGVALSTGVVRFDDADAGRVNTVLTTGKSDIAIMGGGLSGAMTTLQLIAGRLRIDGPTKNSSISPNADIALVAGRSEVTLDSSVSPLTTLRPLASRRDLDAVSDEMLVDITPKGSLSASRVNVSVNARGAGVSYAGRGQASVGDFVISASGKITTKGAVIKAEKGLKIAAGSVEVLNSPQRQSKLSSTSRSVTLLANVGDIVLMGAVTGVERSESDPDARGGVTLDAAGDIKLFTENADRLAIAFSSRDDTFVKAGGDLRNDTGRILSNANTVVRVTGTLANVTETVGGGQQVSQLTRKRAPGFFGRLLGLKRLTQTWVIDWGTSRIPGQVAFLAGETMDIQAGRIVNTGEIDALDGSLLIDAGSLVNTGVYSGILNFQKACDLGCFSYGSSTLTAIGGKINAAGSAEIKARSTIENGGDIAAYGNLSIIAPQVQAYATFLPDFANRPGGLYNFFSGTKALVSFSPTGGSFLAPVGTLTIDSETPVVSYAGTISGYVATNVRAGVEDRRATQAEFPGGLNHIGLLRSWLQ